MNRVLIYEIDPQWHSFKGIRFYAHPTHAILLALLDSGRTVAETVEEAQHLFDLSPQAATEAVNHVLTCYSSALAAPTAVAPITYDLKSFVMPQSTVDVETYRLNRPITLLLRPSDDCMRDCVYCNVQRRRRADVRPLPFGRVKELLDECRDIGIADIGLGGGDPFTSPDIVAIIAASIERGIVPFVSTKSSVSPARARALADAGLDAIQVSVDTADPETADYMTGSRNYLAQVKESILNLRAAGIRVRSNTVVTSRNIRQIPELVELLVKLGVESTHLASMGVSMYAGNTEALLPTYDDREWLAAWLDRLPANWDIHFNGAVSPPKDLDVEERWKRYRNRPRCTAGAWGCIVHSDGKVTLCDEMPLQSEYIVGDVTHTSLMEAWQSPRVLELRQPPREPFRGTVCYECSDFETCHHFGRCFREALKAYGSFYAPAPTCPRAPAARRLF